MMRKNLLSLVPLSRQGGLHESLARVYMTAAEKGRDASSPAKYRASSAATSSAATHSEIAARSMKSRLMMASLFAAFDEEFNTGMPLPRSTNTAAIGLSQALKDSCRERVVLDGEELAYSLPASSAPEVAAKELTDRLGRAIETVAGKQKQTDLGRLTGRILGALCRTGSGGDTYCAVNALFDIAGTIGKSVPVGRTEDREEVS